MNRPGAAAGIAALAVLLFSTRAAAQFFSPGPLARPHARLEGLGNCAKCHEQQKGLAARLCLDCHTEVAARVSKSAGFHGRLPEARRQECQGCHPDHRGLDFAMVDWEAGREKFDHRRAGWPLEGAHAKARCDDCHQRRLVVEASVRHLLEQQPKRVTSLGLATRCDACHFDEHRGQLARECQKCHDEVAWRPAPGFNHQATSYPLLGKHKDVVCAKCHPTVADERTPPNPALVPRAASFMQMTPIAHKTCESCHQDPHKGSFGPACASCHTEAGWKIVNAPGGTDTTFHDKTRYPLRGGHVGVACKSCHGPFPGQPARFKGLAFGACTDCHADAHLGQLAPVRSPKVAACDRCHTVAAFVPARYELEQHAATPFPLSGAHASVACRGCHPTDPALAARISPAVVRMLHARKRPETFSLVSLHPKKAPQACLGCHEDVHRGQLARGADKDSCRACHDTTSWTALTFDHGRDSRFPLTGKHAEAACAACHKPERAADGTKVIRYKPLDTACGSCHADMHQGQFLGQFLVAAARGASSRRPARPGPRLGAPMRPRERDCDTCHVTSGFKKTLFDHDDPKFTKFALEGKHSGVACGRCHPTVRIADGVSTVRYRPLPRFCEECHTDFHHGEFRGFEP
jgi:hypothetical protein